MSNYTKPTIQFMAYVRWQPGSSVMATEDTADTFDLYLDGVEWRPNIDRGGWVDPQDGEDEFQRTLAAARRLIVLVHNMRKMLNRKGERGWHVRHPEYPCEAWGEEPEDALDGLRKLVDKHETDLAAKASGKSNWTPDASASVTFKV